MAGEPRGEVHDMLGDAEIERAAGALAEARRFRRAIDGLPEGCRPTSLADAYAVQDRLIALYGEPIGGWYCACTNPDIQARLGLAEPYYARLLGSSILASPAAISAAHFPNRLILECEFGFRLGRDLAPRPAPYGPDEVAEAVASVHPTLEVVSGFLRNWIEKDIFHVIADNGIDGALVVGPGVADWRRLDLKRMPVELRLNGKAAQRGSGASILGDPFAAFH